MLLLSLKAKQGCWPYHGESECYIILACGLAILSRVKNLQKANVVDIVVTTQYTAESIGVLFPFRSEELPMIGVQW